jgi:hypothetical protein
MKRIFVLIFVLFLLLLNAQTTCGNNNFIQESNKLTDFGFATDLAIYEEHLIVLFQSSPSEGLWIVESYDNGNTWADHQQLLDWENITYIPSITVDSNYFHLIFNAEHRDDKSNASIWYMRRQVQSQHWSQPINITPIQYPFRYFQTNIEQHNGNLYVMGYRYNNSRGGSQMDLFFVKSNDSGYSWGDMFIIDDDAFGGDAPAPSFKIIGNNIFIAYLGLTDVNDVYNILFIKSTDNGKTWNKRKEIARGFAPILEISNNSLIVCYFGGNNTKLWINYSISEDNGLIWNNHSTLNQYEPEWDKNPIRGVTRYYDFEVLYNYQGLCYPEDIGNGTVSLFFLFSNNSGKSWMDEILISQDYHPVALPWIDFNYNDTAFFSHILWHNFSDSKGGIFYTKITYSMQSESYDDLNNTDAISEESRLVTLIAIPLIIIIIIGIFMYIKLKTSNRDRS